MVHGLKLLVRTSICLVRQSSPQTTLLRGGNASADSASASSPKSKVSFATAWTVDRRRGVLCARIGSAVGRELVAFVGSDVAALGTTKACKVRRAADPTQMTLVRPLCVVAFQVRSTCRAAAVARSCIEGKVAQRLDSSIKE